MALPTPPTVTGYSGFYQLTGDMLPYAMTTHAAGGGRSRIEYRIAALLSRQEMRALRAAWLALTGAAAGGTATDTYKRVEAPAAPSGATPAVTQIGDLGCNRNIETITTIDRATTAADEAYIEDMLDDDLLNRSLTPALYPTVAGSGGGGKLINGVVSF
jgi:hypothetical protein